MLMLLLGSTKPSPCSRWPWRSRSCSCSYSLYKTRSLAIERLQHRGGSVSSSIVAADVEDIPGEDRSSDVNNTRPTNRKIRTRTRTNNSNSNTNTNTTNSNSNNIRCRIPEAVWRKSAREHARKIREIILPGLTPLDHPLNTGLQRQIKQREREREREREQYRSKQQQQQQQQQQQSREKQQEQQQQLPSSSSDDYRTTTMVTALDPKHPVYNFLIEYYGLKGTKGVRRLMKWSPGIMAITDDNNNNNDDNDANDCHGDILLEGATEQDFSTTLQTKGAYIYWENNDEPQHNNEAQQNGQSGDCDGIAYSPFHFVYGNNKNKNKNQSKKPNNDNFGLESGDGGDDEQQQQQQQQQQRRGDKPCVAPKTTTTQQQQQDGPLAAFLWYRSLLKRTTEASPVLHCYGLHEWAMQYRPQQHPPRAVNNDGANNSANNSANSNNSNNANVSGKESVPPLPLPLPPPPPSAKYQSHLKLRVDRRTLNETVETNTIFCTHVDAWKFFAEEALPLNTFRNKHKHKTVDGTARSSSSSSLALQLPSPKDRPALLLRSEQPACVHTTMDLLKIALKLGPFCDAELFRKVVAVAIRARSLDVAASPYDANSNCDYGIEPIRIETRHGRNEYRRRQTELMKRAAEPVRKELLEEYERFLSVLV